MRQLRWRSRLTLDVHGAAELGDPSGPAVIVANYASPADPLLVISALPRAWRRRLVVCLPQPDSSEPAPRRWRPPGRTVLVGAGTGRTAAGVLDDVLAGHGSVLCFPEDARSRDGFPGAFRPEILGVAVRRGVPVVPVGLRGSYAAVPDEARRGPFPVESGRPRVSIRLGAPIRAGAGESAAAYTERVEREVRRLIAEDASTWWQTQRDADRDPAPVPGSSWRRIWEQTQTSSAGGRPRPPKIWRG